MRRRRLRGTRGSRLLRQEEVQDRGKEAAGTRLLGCRPGSGWVGGGMSGRESGRGGADRPSACGEPPGVGAALNSLPQLPGCPQLPKAQIRGAGGGGGGGARSLGCSIHTAAPAWPRGARGSVGAPSQQGGGGRARGSVPLGNTLLSYPPRAPSRPVGQSPPPTSPSRPSQVWAPLGTGESLQVSSECPHYTHLGGRRDGVVNVRGRVQGRGR